jgi:putative transposase
VVQGFQKRLAKLQQAMARKRRGSRAWHRLRRAKVRLKAKHKRVLRDLDHKISRAIVDVAVERKAQVIVLGDVRDVADGVSLSKQTNQKIANWSHGKVRQYVEYKASAEGMKVVLVGEAYSSQTCPHCGQRHKPRGRRYRCPSCGFLSHRDVVGQVNILSLYRHGEPGKIPVPASIKHRIPQDLRVMRRCQGTGHFPQGM